MIYYLDVHVSLKGNRGYSIPVKITSEKLLSESEIIEHCRVNKLFQENIDATLVNSIDEITEQEYLNMKGNKK
jgi:hypothetical protein